MHYCPGLAILYSTVRDRPEPGKEKRRIDMSIIHGTTAIDYAEAKGLTLSKYTDPTEEARTGLTVDEAREVAREDPSLIWLDTAEFTDARRFARRYDAAVEMLAALSDEETVKAVDQDWDNGQAIARFADGSRIVFSVGDAEVMTAADCVARQLGDDGQTYESSDDADLDDLAAAAGATVEGVRQDGEDDEPYTVMRHEITTADSVRYAFPDGSAIIDEGSGWGIEGSTLGSWLDA